MTRTIESLARVARWPYAGSPPKSTNSLIKSSMSARDPSGLPNGPTGSSRRRLLAIFSLNLDRRPSKGVGASRPVAGYTAAGNGAGLRHSGVMSVSVTATAVHVAGLGGPRCRALTDGDLDS